MLRTIAEINEKIRMGQAVVVTRVQQPRLWVKVRTRRRKIYARES
jgi:uncharacterized protein (DUF39 family)